MLDLVVVFQSYDHLSDHAFGSFRGGVDSNKSVGVIGHSDGDCFERIVCNGGLPSQNAVLVLLPYLCKKIVPRC